MKKVTVILFAVILVLALGQVTFAKGSISFDGSFLQTGHNNHWSMPSTNGFNFGISGQYELSNSFVISGEFAVSKIFKEESWDTQVATFFYKPSLYLKYNVLYLDNVNLGVQIGASDVFSKIKNESETIIHNFFYVGIGAYANAYIAPNVQIYADMKVPIAIVSTDWRTYAEDERYVNTLVASPIGTIGRTFIDLKLGACYDLMPEVSLGLEGRVSNLGPICYECYRTQYYYYYDNSNANLLWNYSIGAKLTYKF